MKSIKKTSKSDFGTEYVSAQSGQFETMGEAELVCETNLQSEIDAVASSLEADGKTIVGTTQYPFSYQCDGEGCNGGDGDEFWECSGTADIEWVLHENLHGQDQLVREFVPLILVVALSTRLDRVLTEKNPSFVPPGGDLLTDWRKHRRQAWNVNSWKFNLERASHKILYNRKKDFPPSTFPPVAS